MNVKGVITKILKKLKSHNSKNISRNFSEAVVGSVGSVQCQIVPYSGLYLFSRSIGTPQMQSQYQLLGFSLLQLSLREQFPLLYFGFLCFQVSLVSNFCPDTRGQRWLLI